MKLAKCALRAFFLECHQRGGWTVFGELRIAEPQVLPQVLTREQVAALVLFDGHLCAIITALPYLRPPTPRPSIHPLPPEISPTSSSRASNGLGSNSQVTQGDTSRACSTGASSEARSARSKLALFVSNHSARTSSTSSPETLVQLFPSKKATLMAPRRRCPRPQWSGIRPDLMPCRGEKTTHSCIWLFRQAVRWRMSRLEDYRWRETTSAQAFPARRYSLRQSAQDKSSQPPVSPRCQGTSLRRAIRLIAHQDLHQVRACGQIDLSQVTDAFDAQSRMFRASDCR